MRFAAVPQADEIVGVRLWINGAESYVWQE